MATLQDKIICGGLKTNTTTNVMDYTFQCHIFQMDSLGNLEWEWLSPVSDGLRDAANDMLLLDDGSLIVASGVGHEISKPVGWERLCSGWYDLQLPATSQIFYRPGLVGQSISVRRQHLDTQICCPYRKGE
ncbi:MAG: hypothetical protein MUC59_01990 [Saprospiraceae bacterium]|nr:hypothetical protein [Saprospiraceae bacterium]